MIKLLNKYFVRGGFPEIFQIDDLTKSFYALRDDVMNKAIYHDIVTLFKVKEPQIIESMMIYIAGNSAKILSKDELSKDIGIPKQTIYTYLDYVRRSFLASSARNYSRSEKKMLRTMEKWFVSDTSIMNMLNYKDETLLTDSIYMGQIAETVVFNHIHAFAEKMNYRITYWRVASKSEVDIVLDMRKKVVPIEVKYRSSLNRSDINGLLKFMERFSANTGILVTKNTFKKEKINDKEIIFVPLWVILTIF